jgi:hypothetical protein
MSSLPAAQFELTFGGEHFLDPAAQRAGLVLLGSLVLSFLLIRTSTRLMRSPKVPWWPGSITTGGLHVHHLVPGIVLLLLAGFLMALQPASPWFELVAAAFGIGAGLTLDEYALWLHLEDVYWAEEGRRSVDAVIVAASVGGLLLMGFVPFSTDAGVLTIVAGILLAFALAVVTAAKGKYILAVLSMILPLVGLVGSLRLAKPDSPWGRRFYAPDSRKRRRAERRYARYTGRYRRFQDRVAGAPTDQLTDEPRRVAATSAEDPPASR